METKHWDNIYQKKGEKEVSWFQEVPKKSLEIIDALNLPLPSKIIDIGCGNSRLIDSLLSKGYTELTVLDISTASLEKVKERLGNRADQIDFIVSDILEFKPAKKYDLWHDRATFHFLTDLIQVEKYLAIAYSALEIGGHLIVSTFSKSGPDKCSGLSVSQYSENDLKQLFGRYFQNLECYEDTHKTPWGTTQNFVYCGFKKVH